MYKTGMIKYINNKDTYKIYFKFCSICGELKPVTEYHKDKHVKNGLKGACEICDYISTKEWRKNNREKVLVFQKNYRDANKDKISILSMNWAKNNPEKRKESAKRFQANHKEELQKKALEYYHNHKEERKEYVKNNKDKVKLRYIKRLENINDSYVRQLLLNKVQYKENIEIPQELIELKRTIVLIRREIKARRTA